MVRQLDLLEILNAAEPQPPLDSLLTPDQIFESDDVNLFVRLTEDERFERKGSRTEPKGLAPTFSAFANGPSVRGGVVAFGISDKTREIEGCNHLSEDRLQAIECSAMTYTPSARVRSRRVPVQKADGQSDFIVLFRIPYEHSRLVALTDGSAYERISDKTKVVDDTRKQQIRVDKGERQFETESCNLQFPLSFDMVAISAFCDRVSLSRGASALRKNTELLEAFRLGTHVSGRFIPNNACAILFAKDPCWEFPGAKVHFLKYKGMHEFSGKAFNVEKDRLIEGNIGSLIRDAASVIDANLREFTEWTGSRFETAVEYPKDAWYELLVNACVHRSYMARSMVIFIKMFDDRIIFQSPGGLMPGVTPQNIFEKQVPRNRIIMDALRETGEVRCINEGTKRVRLEMERAGLPPPQFREQAGDSATLTVTLLNNAATRSTGLGPRAHSILGGAGPLKLTREEIIIINFVAEGDNATVSDVMGLLGDTRWHTTNMKLSRLVGKGILKSSSTKSRDPKGFYYLASKDPQ